MAAGSSGIQRDDRYELLMGMLQPVVDACSISDSLFNECRSNIKDLVADVDRGGGGARGSNAGGARRSSGGGARGDSGGARGDSGGARGGNGGACGGSGRARGGSGRARGCSGGACCGSGGWRWQEATSILAEQAQRIVDSGHDWRV